MYWILPSKPSGTSAGGRGGGSAVPMGQGCSSPCLLQFLQQSPNVLVGSALSLRAPCKATSLTSSVCHCWERRGHPTTPTQGSLCWWLSFAGCCSLAAPRDKGVSAGCSRGPGTGVAQRWGLGAAMSQSPHGQHGGQR